MGSNSELSKKEIPHKHSPPLKKMKIPPRKIQFNKTVTVFLIPCRLEYVEAGLSNEVWNNRFENNRILIEFMSNLNKFRENEGIGIMNMKQLTKSFVNKELENIDIGMSS